MEFALAYMCCAATLYAWSRITKNQTISDSSFNHWYRTRSGHSQYLAQADSSSLKNRECDPCL